MRVYQYRLKTTNCGYCYKLQVFGACLCQVVQQRVTMLDGIIAVAIVAA